MKAVAKRTRLANVRTVLGRAATAQALMLAAPFVFYLVPFLAGYGWSAISPKTPHFPGMVALSDRQPALPTAVEHYGTGVVVVPFQARLRAYLRDGDLPLWNPYSGLGQPFAAQGEGSPYFPFAILRSLLPTSWSNAVTFVMIGISAACLYLFLRVLGLGAGAAAFGGAAWALSGQFTLNVARNNYVDQFGMIPPLFLAAAWAITSRRVTAYVCFAAVVALHAIAGMLQVGVNTLLLLGGFIAFFSCLRMTTPGSRLRTIVTLGVFGALGTALAAPYVLPIVEGVQAAYNKNVPYLAFLTMPSANVAAFFFPLLFGQIFQTWIAGTYPDVADWNNLYAHGSTGLLLLAVCALAALPRDRRDERLTYFFFLGGLLFLHGRYMSFPPVSLVSILPILSQQSPKHTNGVAVFCLVVVAAFGVAWLRRTEWRRARWLLGAVVLALASTILTTIGRRGGFAEVDVQMAAVYLGVTLTLGTMLVSALWLAHRAPTDVQAALIATAAIVGESSVYLLLGNGDLPILLVRIGICALVTLVGVLAARGALRPAVLTSLVALGAYAWVVIWPEAGLPKRVEVDAVPGYMAWLHEEAGHEYRSFGIYPDYSSIAEIQDVEVVGPLATNEWVSFVDMVSSPTIARFHRNGSTFALDNQIDPTFWYDLKKDYLRTRSLFDWVGVRYIVLDTAVFNGRVREDHEALLGRKSGLVIAYEDEVVTILESPTAESKAFFTSRVREASARATIERLQDDPDAIWGPVTVERAIGDLTRGGPGRDAGRDDDVPVPLAAYEPNGLRAMFDASAPGVFVVRDSYFPGWEATLNGQPAEVLRVNGLVRGVVVPEAGRHEITMSYRPVAFTAGVALAAVALVALLALLAWEHGGRRSAASRLARTPRRSRLHPEPGAASPERSDSCNTSRNDGRAGLLRQNGLCPGWQSIREELQMKIELGSKVTTADGKEIGTIDKLILDPESGNVHAIVVRKGMLFGKDIEIPVDAVVAQRDGTATIEYTAERVESLPTFHEGSYTTPPPERSREYLTGYDYPTASLLWPSSWSGPFGGARYGHEAVGGVSDEVARMHRVQDLSNAVIKEGSDVRSRNGEKLGEVHRLVFDPATERPATLVIRKGFLFTEDVEVPASLISSVDDDVVYLDVRHDELEGHIHPPAR